MSVRRFRSIQPPWLCVPICAIVIAGLAWLAAGAAHADTGNFVSSYPVSWNASSGLGICQTSDHAYMIAGVDSTNNARDILTKVGSSGEFLWTHHIGDSLGFSQSFALVAMPNGGAAIVGRTRQLCCGDANHLRVMRVDRDGNLLWTFLGPPRSSGMGLTRTADGGLVALGNYRTGTTGPFNAFLVRLNSSGDSLWTRVLPIVHPATNIPASVIEMPNGDLVGNAYSQPAGTDYATVFRTSSSGTLLWTASMPFASQCYAVAPYPDGSILTGGYATDPILTGGYLARLSSAGDTLWTRPLGDSGCNALARNPAGGFYLLTVGTYPSAGIDLVTEQIDDNGAPLSTRHFGSDGDETIGSVIVPTADGGFATSGFTAPLASTPGVLVVKVATAPLDTLRIGGGTITGSLPVAQPVEHRGPSALGVVSLYFNYDATKLVFAGVQSHVAGQVFQSGLVSGRISVQWFDNTGGLAPIPAAADTLFDLLFTAATGVNDDSTIVTFDTVSSSMGDAAGLPLPTLLFDLAPSRGHIKINRPISVSGHASYYAHGQSVPGTHLSLGSLAPVTTDAQGNFAFSPVPVGAYVLQPTKTSDLGGINSLDALKVIRHSIGAEIIADTFKRMAADVTRDSTINAFDAFRIVQAAVGIAALPFGDWRFSPDSHNYGLINHDLTGQDFTAIRVGDVNGDWAPDAAPLASGPRTISGAARQESGATAAMQVSLPDTVISVFTTTLHTRVTIQGLAPIGAMSLRVAYPDTVLAYTGVTSLVGGVSLTANSVGNVVRIEWFDATGGGSPILLGTGLLLSIDWSVVGAAGDTARLVFGPDCSIGDAVGDPMAGIAYANGRVRIGNPTGSAPPPEPITTLRLASAMPNPFTGSTQLEYALPERARVQLRIYDVTGAQVRVLADGWSEPGVHAVTWDGRTSGNANAPAGLYLVRMESGGRSLSRKLVRVQ